MALVEQSGDDGAGAPFRQHDIPQGHIRATDIRPPQETVPKSGINFNWQQALTDRQKAQEAQRTAAQKKKSE